MKKLIQYILIIYGFSYSQALIPTLYKMKDFAFDTTAYKGLKSNMVSDIVQQGDTVVWLGTGSGLAVLKDSTSMYTINSTENLSANLKDKEKEDLKQKDSTKNTAFIKSIKKFNLKLI